MSELKEFECRTYWPVEHGVDDVNDIDLFYLKSEADKVIAEKDAEIARLKNGIAPKQSDKTLQERLNEVCEKHGVSTLQDLDWAFCMAEARLEDYAKLAAGKHEALDKMLQYKVLYEEKCKDINTQERFFAEERVHNKYKRCLAMARLCHERSLWWYSKGYGFEKYDKFWEKWEKRWLELAAIFKEAK